MATARFWNQTSCPPAQSLPNEMLSAKTLKFVFFGENKNKTAAKDSAHFVRAVRILLRRSLWTKHRWLVASHPAPPAHLAPTPKTHLDHLQTICSSVMSGNSERHPQIQYPRWHLPMKKFINRCPFQAQVPSNGRKIPIYYSFIKKRKRVTKQLLLTCLHTRY